MAVVEKVAAAAKAAERAAVCPTLRAELAISPARVAATHRLLANRGFFVLTAVGP